MGKRTDLQTILSSIDGVKKVYFQPPESVKLVYPCIIYSLSSIDTVHADDMAFTQFRAYQVIVIDKNPDSSIANYISTMPSCSFERAYGSDQLNHFVFRLFY